MNLFGPRPKFFLVAILNIPLADFGQSQFEVSSLLLLNAEVPFSSTLSFQNSIFSYFQKKRKPNTPEFKNWFYIYKNYTVEQELQEVLRKYYLTEVKSVDRPDDFIDENEKKITLQPSKEKEKEKESEVEMEVPAVAETVSVVDSEEAASNNEESLLDKPQKEKVKEEKPLKKQDSDCIEEEAEVSEIKDKEMMIAMQRKVKRDATENVKLDHFSGMTDSSLKIKGSGK